MNWFNNKKGKETNYLFYKEIEYKNQAVCIWVRDYESTFFNNRIVVSFETGWNIKNGYGHYTTGVHSDNLEQQINSHLESAKQYIEEKINEPNVIKEALNKLKTIEI